MWFTLGCVKGGLSPNEWLFLQLSDLRKRNPACGWSKSCWRRSKSSLRSVEICGRCPQTMKPRNLFGFGASFTLAAIYSRGTCRPTTIDVLMFHFRVRNGTGWDHQAMTTRFQEAASCSLLAYLAVICACGLLCCVCWLPCGSRLTSAWLVGLSRFPCLALTLGYT